MKRKAIVPLVLGLVVGVFTVKFGIDTIRKAQDASAATTKVKMVRAKMDIRAFDEIGPEMVEVIETNETILVPQAERLDELEKAVGRVTSKAIPAGAPVFASMLAPEGTPKGMVGRIPPGFRAVSVKIDEVAGVAYQIQPGDWVDVIVVMDVDTGVRGKKETIAEVILQKVQVAAMGNATNPPADGSPAKTTPAKSATLFVNELDVPKLHLANSRGKITLAMRGTNDRSGFGHLSADMGDVVPGLKPKKKGSGGMSPFMAMLGFGGGAEAGKKEVVPTPVRVVDQTPLPEPDPRTVLIVRGSSSVEDMQRITFEGEDSSRILAITSGVVGGTGAQLRTPSRERTIMKGTKRGPQT